MRMWRVVLGSAVVMASMTLAAPVVHAQGGPPSRPFRALFGADDTSRPARHELNFTSSLSAAVDNNATASPGVNPPQPGEAQNAGRSELYTAGAQLAYTLRDSRVTLNASGAASYPYYSLVPEQADSPAYGGDISLAFSPGETTVSGYGRYFYSPYYAPFLQPGYAPSGGAFDYASALSANEMLSGGATLARRLGRSTSASAGYYIAGTRFLDEERTNGNEGVRVSMSSSVSRSVSLSGGYGYSRSRVADTAAASRSESHGVDASLGYSHQWSRSSATSFSGSIGWATVKYIDSSSDRWVGSVGVGHATGSWWSVSASYGRTLQYPERHPGADLERQRECRSWRPHQPAGVRKRFRRLHSRPAGDGQRRGIRQLLGCRWSAGRADDQHGGLSQLHLLPVQLPGRLRPSRRGSVEVRSSAGAIRRDILAAPGARRGAARAARPRQLAR